MNLGDFTIGQTLAFAVNTHDPATGAESDADSVPLYRIYRDNEGTPVATGTMTLTDDANTTGYYAATVTLSAGNGFTTAHLYTIRIRAVVNYTAGVHLQHFSIGMLAPQLADAVLDEPYTDHKSDGTLGKMLLWLFLRMCGKRTITEAASPVETIYDTDDTSEFTVTFTESGSTRTATPSDQTP